MAEGGQDRDSEDLGEEISHYRLEEQRRKGQVSQSREVTGMLALVAAAAATYALSPSMGESLMGYMREVFRVDMASKLDLSNGAVLGGTLVKGLKIMAAVCLPIALAGFFVGVLGSFAQIGAIFSFDPLSPNLEKIDPIKGLQRLVSMKTLIEGLRLILKLAAAATIAYALIKSEIFASPSQWLNDPEMMFTAFARAGKSVFLSIVGVLFVFALMDFGLQKFDYRKGLRLTKEEAKQEHKEKEGDPQVKARIRGIQREMARKRMMQAVKKADVIVTNPTHIAIAIVYDRENMAAPKVVAKGADFLAQRIKKIAADAGVPLVENVPLARTLYKSVKVGQYVPRALYQAVAEVLAYVYRLRNRRF